MSTCSSSLLYIQFILFQHRPRSRFALSHPSIRVLFTPHLSCQWGFFLSPPRYSILAGGFSLAPLLHFLGGGRAATRYESAGHACVRIPGRSLTPIPLQTLRTLFQYMPCMLTRPHMCMIHHQRRCNYAESSSPAHYPDCISRVCKGCGDEIAASKCFFQNTQPAEPTSLLVRMFL